MRSLLYTRNFSLSFSLVHSLTSTASNLRLAIWNNVEVSLSDLPHYNGLDLVHAQSSLVPSSTETCFRAPEKAMSPCGTQNLSGAVSLGSSPITLPLELQIPFHSPSTLSYLELLLHLTSFLYLLTDAVSSSLEPFLLVCLANSTSSVTTLLSCNFCKASLTISLFYPLLLP